MLFSLFISDHGTQSRGIVAEVQYEIAVNRTGWETYFSSFSPCSLDIRVILVLFSRWNFVYAWTNGSYQDEQQAYAAGYLEIRSDPLITMQYKNTMSGNVPCHQRKIVLLTCTTEHHVIFDIQVSAQTVQLQAASGYRNFWLPILTSWKRKLFRRGRRILSGTRCVFLLFVSFPQILEKFFQKENRRLSLN